MRGDERLRELGRRLAATSNAEDAKRYLIEAVRTGRWLDTSRERFSDVEVERRLGTLRFLGYLGWRDAIDLLRALPWEGVATPTALSALGPQIAATVSTPVLSAAAAAACMAVSHLVPASELNAQEAITVFGDLVEAIEDLVEAKRLLENHPWRGGEAEEDSVWRSLYENERRAAANAWRMATSIRPERGIEGYRVRTTRDFAVRMAREGWADLLTAPDAHQINRPKAYAGVIFLATYALAWEHETHDGERPEWGSQEWRALPETHWLRAQRMRRDASDHYGARPSTRATRIANQIAKKAMLGPALVAAATLVR